MYCRTKIKQTVLTSVTGKEVNIQVDKNTNLKGSLLAAGEYDENGNFKDNGDLNLTTDTLTYQNSTNRVYDSSKSFNVGVGLGFGEKKNDDGTTSDTTSLTIANLGYSNSNTYSKSKTLATLGQGNITINDTDNSDDTTALNRDVTKTNKDIYSAKTGVEVEMTVDHMMVVAVKNLLSNVIEKSFPSSSNDIEIVEEKFTEKLNKLKENNPLMYKEAKEALQNYQTQLEDQRTLSKDGVAVAPAVPLIIYDILISTGAITATVALTEDARNNSVDGIMGEEVGMDYKDAYVPPPKDITDLFPNAIPVKNKNQRKRWKNSKTGDIYEWDYQHGDVEIYNKTGQKHKGSVNKETGSKKPADKTKKTDN